MLAKLINAPQKQCESRFREVTCDDWKKLLPLVHEKMMDLVCHVGESIDLDGEVIDNSRAIADLERIIKIVKTCCKEEEAPFSCLEGDTFC